MPPPPSSTLFPYTTLFRSADRIPDPDTEVGLGVTEHEELLTLLVGVADRHPPLVGLTSDLPGRPPEILGDTILPIIPGTDPDEVAIVILCEFTAIGPMQLGTGGDPPTPIEGPERLTFSVVEGAEGAIAHL